MHEYVRPSDQVERLFGNLPIEGLGMHGTSAVNAERIAENGFRVKKNFFQNDWLHFFYLHPKENISNPQRTANELRTHLDFMHSKGLRHCNLQEMIQTPKLVLFVPNLAESEQVPSDNPMSRFDEGSPIWIRTRNFNGHNILGICDFSYRKGGLDTQQTLDSMNKILEQYNAQHHPLYAGRPVFLTSS